jgi:hypothetical protein
VSEDNSRYPSSATRKGTLRTPMPAKNPIFAHTGEMQNDDTANRFQFKEGQNSDNQKDRKPIIRPSRFMEADPRDEWTKCDDISAGR